MSLLGFTTDELCAVIEKTFNETIDDTNLRRHFFQNVLKNKIRDWYNAEWMSMMIEGWSIIDDGDTVKVLPPNTTELTRPCAISNKICIKTETRIKDLPGTDDIESLAQDVDFDELYKDISHKYQNESKKSTDARLLQEMMMSDSEDEDDTLNNIGNNFDLVGKADHPPEEGTTTPQSTNSVHGGSLSRGAYKHQNCALLSWKSDEKARKRQNYADCLEEGSPSKRINIELP